MDKWINGLVVLIMIVITIVSWAFLIPLDSVQAVSGFSIIAGISYGLSFLGWLIVMGYYMSGWGRDGKPEENTSVTWILVHLMFWVVLPTTITATAMNVTSVMNTRNILAGKIST